MNSRTRPSGPAVQETATIRNAISRILRHAREAAPAATAALASGLLCPLALGAPGDLDPSFGDVGRTGLMVDFAGPAWSVEPVDDGQVIFAGGDDNTCYSDYYCGDDGHAELPRTTVQHRGDRPRFHGGQARRHRGPGHSGAA